MTFCKGLLIIAATALAACAYDGEIDGEMDEGDLENIEAGASAYPSPWTATPGTITMAAGAATTPAINGAIGRAAQGARPFRPPTPTSGAAAGLGPNAPQAVVRIVYAAGQGDFTGDNDIALSGPIQLRSNVRLEIDSGIKLRRAGGWSSAGGIVDLSGETNVTVTAGDRTHGGGLSMAGRSLIGRFLIDTSAAPSGSRWQAVLLSFGTSYFLVERFHSKQSTVTNTAAVVSRSETSPHHGVYQHHSNSNSPYGYGPNQLVSLRNAYINDLWTDGGTALRYETDGNATGVHDVTAEGIYAQRGSRAVSLTPHCQQNDHVTVRGIRTESVYYGITLGGTPSGSLPDCRNNPGRFLNTLIEDACIVAGREAEEPVGVGVFDATPDRTSSNKAVDDRSPANDSITLSGIHHNEDLARFTAGPGPRSTTSAGCSP